MNARTLALRLAFLAPEDQQWVLSHLPDETRDLFQSLRDEVVCLGLNADPSVLAHFQSAHRESDFSASKQHQPVEATDPAQALPLFWRSLLEKKTTFFALQLLNGLPPAMEKKLYQYAETLKEKQGLNRNEQCS